MSSNYTYTIFDGDPNLSSGTAWPSHQDIEIEAEGDDEALTYVLGKMAMEATGLSVSDDYEVGQRLYALVWDEDETIVGQPTYELTAEDLGATKDSVDRWESIASYVATFPADDGEGAADVNVQIGEAAGVWFMRTNDDAGGSDEADDTAYDTREAAEAAAEAFAAEHDEGDGEEDAEGYLRARDEAAAGEPDPTGEWCVYWATALDDAGPRERYETAEQARAATRIANKDLRARHPGNLLCGYEVRQLVDGEWSNLSE